MSEDTPVHPIGLAALLRRITKKNPSSTTITVTRVTGTHTDEETGEEVPDTVIVTTEAPPPVKEYPLAKAAMLVAGVALAFTVSGWILRTLRGEFRR